MAASVEKTYADALFALLEDENADKAVFDMTAAQLRTAEQAVSAAPEFVKFLSTPTVSKEEKLAVVERTFAAGFSGGYVYNFLRLLTVKGRMGYLRQIDKAFRAMYNEKFGIAEITVTSAMPLTAEQRAKITAKMEQITRKSVSLTERLDKSVIGGIVVDYGNNRLDGSVKTRLAELKKEIAGYIA